MTYNLDRFVTAQQSSYAQALAEIEAGRKRTHWMWFVFPQLKGLGYSSTAQFYGLSGIAEAEAYLAHPVLGPRLVQIATAALQHPEKTPLELFGSPDNLKFQSCMTLFACLPQTDPLFRKALETFFSGTEDAGTLRLL
ncbi:MAG: DUF1810 domain-containing protein [Sphingobacteriales bacterium]|nr:MAG: DUF1810 domain-containing protein [Sphingobacteriales bacterium]